MSNEDEGSLDWRTAIVIDDDDDEGPDVVMKDSGESAFDVLNRVLDAGKWDAEGEPGLAPLLELAAELLSDDAVLNWVDREVLMATENTEAQQARRCFMNYQSATALEDMDTAVKLLDGTTRERILKYLEFALAGGGAIPDSPTPSLDRICIELFRTVIPPEELENITEEEAIAFTLDHLFAGPEGFEQFRIGSIEVEDGHASAELFAGDAALPIDLVFTREKDAWRMNLASLFPLIETTYAAIARQRGMTTEEFITLYLDSAANAEVDEDEHREN